MTTLPSCTTAKLVGAAGGVKSKAFTVASSDLLFEGSMAFTDNVWLSFCGVVKLTENEPVGSVVPVPITLPAGSLITIFEFGSALPVTTLPSCTTAKLVGAAGGVLSGATSNVGTDSL